MLNSMFLELFLRLSGGINAPADSKENAGRPGVVLSLCTQSHFTCTQVAMSSLCAVDLLPLKNPYARKVHDKTCQVHRHDTHSRVPFVAAIRVH